MILAEIEIQDYKQFHGTHRFLPPPEGIIAIIGHNGAGKTTLFEAIEWCLFQPRSIAAADVPTRGQSAKPRVKVVLLDPATGIRYVIVRSLKRAAATAEIYLEHEPESRIVEGSRQVTEHVGRDLIGLGHTAFVSTFFTRQKELSFFGAMNETERRREVGRLLGMETIREAQKQIAEERLAAQREADGARAAWLNESADRDFGAELEAAAAAVEARQAQVGQAESAHASAAAAHESARKLVESLRAVQQQDGELAQATVKTTAALQAARKRHDAAQLELERLDREAERRAALVDEAAKIPALQAAERAHECQREAHAKRTRLSEQCDRIVANEARDAKSVIKAVRDSGVSGFPGWGFSSDDVARLPDSLDALISTAEGVDAIHARQHAIALSHAIDLEKRQATINERLVKYRGAVARLMKQRDLLLSCGDPAEAIAQLERRRQSLLAQTEQGNAEERAAKDQLAKVKPVADRLRHQQLGDVCPTCQRPYTEEDLNVMLPLLERQIEEANCSLSGVATRRRELDQQVAVLAPQLREHQARASEIAVLAGRIADGGKTIEAEERDFEDAAAALHRHLEGACLTAVPAQAEADTADRYAGALARITGTLPVLTSLRESLERHRDDREAAERVIAEIGEICYDPAAHQAAREALTNAQNAAAAIQEIERQLALRPQRERERATAASEIEAALESQTDLEAQRARLSFDPEALRNAASLERQRLAGERASRDAKAEAVSHLDRCRSERERVAADHQRITRLAERSEAKMREADTLREMYNEFSGFERFVALRIAPALAESTADLLRAVTDGQYDNVRVTESYGIEVYDGPEESFPIEQFSGGERDVISLCARLALSRLIGGQANHPPGFLVLDEVFGSLDRDRRLHVLETLGTLSTATDAFKQLFIISHVDDVRSSPIFNEVWRISEDADGISRLENLSATGGLDE